MKELRSLGARRGHPWNERGCGGQEGENEVTVMAR